jgi:hypothetical protein
MLSVGYIECELEDSITNAQSTVLGSGYELKIKDEKNITNTLADVISKISSKYDIWKIIFKIELIMDNNSLFYFYRHIDIYDGNLTPLYQLHDFTPYYGEEENDIGEGKISIEINLSAEFSESLIFMSSYDKEESLRPIKEILEENDIIVDYDISGGRIYLEVPVEVEVVKYFI